MSTLPRSERSLVSRAIGLMLPVTGTYALEGCGFLIPLIAASHCHAGDEAERDRAVGALGLGSTVLTCVAFVARAGWTGGQDALVPQAFGKGDFAMARMHLHRCQIWMTVFAMGCAVLLCFTEPLLTVVGVADSHTASLARNFVFACIPGIWFDFQYDTLRKFLLNQGLPTPSLVVLAVAFPVQLLCCALLLQQELLPVMHSLGAAWTTKAMVSFLLLAGYISWSKPTPSCAGWWWPWHAALSWRGLVAFAKFGLPSMAMYGCDWWAWEVLTLLAGGLKDGPELAAHVAAASASDWLFMLMRGTPKAATVMVGTALGKGDLSEVVAAVHACAYCCVVLCASVILAIWSFRHSVVAWLLPMEGPAQDCLAKLLPLVALQLALDTANSLCQGVIAGLGRQGAACVGMFVSCWVVQLPGAMALAFRWNMGVWGLRVAGCLAAALSLTYNTILLCSCLTTRQSELDVREYAALRSESHRRTD
mmetsp:Transcript_76263/g.177005  ORF Transcript_76263/g.177005 Transcript_76263/m.177005 type:complete len:478 (+) Transcript_76263:129-1562(+)